MRMQCSADSKPEEREKLHQVGTVLLACGHIPGNSKMR